jgi:hypothetical protein
MSDQQLREQFEKAFSDHVGSCRGSCFCGRVFYNSDGGWTFEDEELEGLAANTKATDLPYTVGFLTFEGATYIDACDCWWPRAKKIAQFILMHAAGIAEFLSLERERLQLVATHAPTVRVPAPPDAEETR